MDNAVIISIIIPVFNEERTIDKCLWSIYEQSIKNIEIICCDDGSTDQTLSILHTYEQMYDNIKVFKQDNLGAGAARNFCLRQAVGEFVCFMDADDYYIDTKALEMIYNTIVGQGLDVGCAFMQQNNENGEIEHIPLFRNLVDEKPKVVTFKEYQNDTFFQCYMIRRRLIEDNNITFPLFRRFQDPIFLAQCLHIAKKFVVIPVEFYFHRRDDNKIIYDQVKTNDMAKGLKCQLKFAIDYEYLDLKEKTRHRINEYYSKWLIQNINPDNYELLKILIEINDLLDTKQFVLNALKYFVMDDKADDFNTRKLKYIIKNKMDEGYSILLYGAGNVGKQAVQILSNMKEIEVKGWIDKNKCGDIWNGFLIMPPAVIEEIEFDYILIAIERKNIAEEVCGELLEIGVPDDRIICW